MSNFFEGTRSTDARHSHFTSIGQNQYQYHIHNTHISGDRQSALTALQPVDRSRYYVPPCLPGTRRWIVEKIHVWLRDDQVPNIIWISESLGAGKS
jgi:hypothetical protein